VQYASPFLLPPICYLVFIHKQPISGWSFQRSANILFLMSFAEGRKLMADSAPVLRSRVLRLHPGRLGSTAHSTFEALGYFSRTRPLKIKTVKCTSHKMSGTAIATSADTFPSTSVFATHGSRLKSCFDNLVDDRLAADRHPFEN
jgi:hypothetical protein